MKITSRTEPNLGYLTMEQYHAIRTQYIREMAEEYIVERAELIDKLDVFLEERIRVEFEELQAEVQALLEVRDQLKVARNVIDHLVEENTVLSNTCAKLQRMLEKLSAIVD